MSHDFKGDLLCFLLIFLSFGVLYTVLEIVKDLKNKHKLLSPTEITAPETRRH